jgi:hypothetical protein
VGVFANFFHLKQQQVWQEVANTAHRQFAENATCGIFICGKILPYFCRNFICQFAEKLFKHGFSCRNEKQPPQCCQMGLVPLIGLLFFSDKHSLRDSIY